MAWDTLLHLYGPFILCLGSLSLLTALARGSSLPLKVSGMFWLAHRCPIFFIGWVPGCLSAAVLLCPSATKINITLFPGGSLKGSPWGVFGPKKSWLKAPKSLEMVPEAPGEQCGLGKMEISSITCANSIHGHLSDSLYCPSQHPLGLT